MSTPTTATRRPLAAAFGALALASALLLTGCAGMGDDTQSSGDSKAAGAPEIAGPADARGDAGAATDDAKPADEPGGTGTTAG